MHWVHLHLQHARALQGRFCGEKVQWVGKKCKSWDKASLVLFGCLLIVILPEGRTNNICGFIDWFLFSHWYIWCTEWEGQSEIHRSHKGMNLENLKRFRSADVAHKYWLQSHFLLSRQLYLSSKVVTSQLYVAMKSLSGFMTDTRRMMNMPE